MSEKMSNRVSEVTNFTIKDNILIGFKKSVEGVSYNVGQALFDALTETPDHVAQIEIATGQKTTFRELKERSIRCALWMEKQNLKQDDIVVVCTHNHSDTCVPVLATYFVQAIHNAWSNDITLHAARHLMKLLEPKLIFANADAVDVLREAASLEHVDLRIVTFGTHADFQSFDEILKDQSEAEIANFKPIHKKSDKDVSTIFLTSGSTGYPKGAMFSSEAIVKNTYPDTFFIKHKNYLWYSPLCWGTGFIMVLTSIFNRALRIIPSDTNAESTCEIIQEYKAEQGFLSPVFLTQIAKLKALEDYNLKSLTEVVTGGTKISKSVMERLHSRIPHLQVYQRFGMSEMGQTCIIQSEKRTSYESLGFVAWNLEVKIIDRESGKALGPNERGELCLKTPTMMLGYYKNPTTTEETVDKEGWLHSGDVCYYKENGEIFLIDRLKEIMKFRLYQVTPTEIEDILLSHPAVSEVCVVPVPHEIDGDRPMAFVKKVFGKEVTAEELIELSAVLGENKKLWGGVQFMDELPKTSSGKIARSELKPLAKNFSTVE